MGFYLTTYGSGNWQVLKQKIKFIFMIEELATHRDGIFIHNLREAVLYCFVLN